MDLETKVLSSVILHIRTALTTAGFTNPATSNWVNEGYVDPQTKTQIVGIVIPYSSARGYELGNTERVKQWEFQIEIFSPVKRQRSLIQTKIEQCLHTIPVINFDTYMPGDVGYDATAQTVAYLEPVGDINSSIIDALQQRARIIVTLEADQPLS